MKFEVIEGILIPFIGTTIGSAGVFLLKNGFSSWVERALTGFAGGVMVAASVWSLIIPAIESSSNLGALSFLPAVVGFWVGILFMIAIDKALPCGAIKNDGRFNKQKKQNADFCCNYPQYTRGYGSWCRTRRCTI